MLSYPSGSLRITANKTIHRKQAKFQWCLSFCTPLPEADTASKLVQLATFP
jgi:hypothetical protein